MVVNPVDLTLNWGSVSPRMERSSWVTQPARRAYPLHARHCASRRECACTPSVHQSSNPSHPPLRSPFSLRRIRASLGSRRYHRHLDTPPSDMRAQVQEIFFKTPHTKQVMMFSATLSPEVRPICRKFCHEKVRAKTARQRQRETKRALRTKRKNVKIYLRPNWCIRRRCRRPLTADAGKAWCRLRCTAPGSCTPRPPLRYKYTFFFPTTNFFLSKDLSIHKQPPSHNGGKEAGDHAGTCA